MTTADEEIIELLEHIHSDGGTAPGGGAAWGGITGTLSAQTDLNSALAAKAALASPALTGTPTAPTAAPGTNTTQISTTGFVKAAIDVVLGGVAGAFDTLAEIATQLGLLAPIASPTFTGTVAGITKAMVGLGSADNTADTAKPVSTAQQTALDLKANLASIIRADSTVTQANDANPHAIFTTPANGRLTLPTGTYLFKGQLAWTAMSATSGNIKIDILGAGTATAGAWLWSSSGQDVASAQAAANFSGSWAVTSASVVSAVNAAVNTAAIVEVRGTFEVTVAGTIIPTQTLVTAAPAVLSVGSFLHFERIGSETMTSVGAWD